MTVTLEKEELERSTNPYIVKTKGWKWAFFPAEVQAEIALYQSLVRGLITHDGKSLSDFYQEKTQQTFDVDLIPCHRKLDEILKAYCINQFTDDDPDLSARIKHYVRQNLEFDLDEARQVYSPVAINDLVELVRASRMSPDKTKLSAAGFYTDVARGITLDARYLQQEERLCLIARKYKKLTEREWGKLTPQERDERINDAREGLSGLCSSSDINKLASAPWDTLTEEEKAYSFEGMSLDELYRMVYKHPWDECQISCQNNLDDLLIKRLGISPDQLEHLKIQYSQTPCYVAKSPLLSPFLSEEALNYTDIPGLIQLVITEYRKPDEFHGFNLSYDGNSIHMHSTVPFQCARAPHNAILYKLEGQITTHSLLESATFIQQEVVFKGENAQFLADCYRGDKTVFQRLKLSRLSFQEALAHGEFDYKERVESLTDPGGFSNINGKRLLIKSLNKIYQTYSDGYCEIFFINKKPTADHIAKIKAKHVYFLVKDDSGWSLNHYSNGIRVTKNDILIKGHTTPKYSRLRALLAKAEQEAKVPEGEIKEVIKNSLHLEEVPEALAAVSAYEDERNKLILRLNLSSQNQKNLLTKVIQELPIDEAPFFSQLNQLIDINNQIIISIEEKKESLLDCENEPGKSKAASLKEVLSAVLRLQVFLVRCKNPASYDNKVDFNSQLQQRLSTYEKESTAAFEWFFKKKTRMPNVVSLIEKGNREKETLLYHLKNDYVKKMLDEVNQEYQSNSQLDNWYRELGEEMNLFKLSYQRIEIIRESYRYSQPRLSEKERIEFHNVSMFLSDLAAKISNMGHPKHFVNGKNNEDYNAILIQQLTIWSNYLTDALQSDFVEKNETLQPILRNELNHCNETELKLYQSVIKSKKIDLHNPQNEDFKKVAEFYAQDTEITELKDTLASQLTGICEAMTIQSKEWAECYSLSFNFSQWLETQTTLHKQLVDLYILQESFFELQNPQNFKEISNLEAFKDRFKELIDAYLKQIQKIRNNMNSAVSCQGLNESNNKDCDALFKKLNNQYKKIVSSLDADIKNIINYINPSRLELLKLKKSIKQKEQAIEKSWDDQDEKFRQFYSVPDSIPQKLITTLGQRSKYLNNKLQEKMYNSPTARGKDSISKLMVKLLTISRDYEMALRQRDKFPESTSFNQTFLNLLDSYEKKIIEILGSADVQEFGDVKDYLARTLEEVHIGRNALTTQMVKSLEQANLQKKEKALQTLQCRQNDDIDQRNKAKECPELHSAILDHSTGNLSLDDHVTRLKMVDKLWKVADILILALDEQYNNQPISGNQGKIREQQFEVLRFQEKLMDCYNHNDVSLLGFYELYYSQLNNLRDLKTQLLPYVSQQIENVLKNESYNKAHRQEYFKSFKLKYAVAVCLGLPNSTDPGTRCWPLSNIFRRSLTRRKQEYEAIKALSIQQIIDKANVGTTSLLAQGLKPALTRFLDGGASEESFAYDLLQMKRQLGKEKGVEGSLWNLLNWFGFGNQKLHHQLYTQCLTLNQEFGKNCAAIERNRMRYDRGYREQLLTEISELTAKAKAIEIPEPLYQAIDSEFKPIFGKWAKRTAVCRRQAQTLLKDMNLPDVEQPSAVVDLRSAYSGSHNN